MKVGEVEIAALVRFLGVSEFEFVQRFTRLRPDRLGLSLIEKENGECIFLEGRDCAVQPVKPGQCAGFPNAWNFPGWRETCEAVPRLETRMTNNEWRSSRQVCATVRRS